MKHLLLISVAALTLLAATSCGKDDNNWDDYTAWRDANYQWYLEQSQLLDEDGNPFYTQLNPLTYPQSGVLIHYFNDRTLTAGNLRPYVTSTVKVKYIGRLYDGTIFDQTNESTSETRSFSVNGTITGWKIAIPDMHVGDTCQVVLPYPVGYGSDGSSSIPPYSTLQFNIRLVDIPDYEIR